jgi:hypothetical protein
MKISLDSLGFFVIAVLKNSKFLCKGNYGTDEKDRFVVVAELHSLPAKLSFTRS